MTDAEPTPSVPLDEPPIELTLVPALRMLLLRGISGALIGVGLLLLIFRGLPGPSWANTARALKVGLPVGFLLLTPTVLAEVWGQRGRRSPWAVAALAWLLVLIGWVLGFLQASYALELDRSHDAAAAFLKVLHEGPSLFQRSSFLLVSALWPLPVALGLLLKLGRLQRRAGWTAAMILCLGLAIYGARATGLGSRFPLVVPLLIVLLTPIFWALLTALDRVYLQLWPPEREHPDPTPTPLTWGEWIAYGGPTFVPGGALWLGTALVLFVNGAPWIGGLSLLVLFAHALVSGNLPKLLLARRRPERAIAVALRQLHDRVHAGGRGRRHPLTVLIRAHLYLGQVEEADAFLPELRQLLGSGVVDLACRQHAALAYLQAGLPERALELIEELPEAEWRPAMRPYRTLVASVALGQLERVDEALALLDTIDLERAPRTVRAVVKNNRAIYLLDHLDDPAAAHTLAEEALALGPASQLPALRATVGATSLASGGDPRTALEHLEQPDLDDPLQSPYGKAWLLLHRGRAHQALGEPDEARRLWTTAAELPGRSARRAREALTALDEGAT